MKFKFLLPVIFITLALIACRRTRTCDCSLNSTQVTTIGNTSNTQTTLTSTVTTKNKQKKADFESAESCYSVSTTYTTEIVGGTIATNDVKKCTLK